jgi:hypothetical protein
MVGAEPSALPRPPVPELVQISVGDHPADHGQLPYNRMSFAFTGAFPGYHFEWASKLVSDGSGQVVPLRGTDVLKIVFTTARPIPPTGRDPRSFPSPDGPSATRS